jgi:hypothetical protein
MIVDCIQVCCRNEVIAELTDNSNATPQWFIPLQHGKREVIEDAQEIAQLYRCIEDPDFAGYMIFRAREYEDVVTCVVL